METTVNPQRFLKQEMTLSPLSRGQSAVLLAGFRIGRISHAPCSDGKTSWLWSLTGPHCSGPADMLPVCGKARTLGDAKLQLRAVFDRWLEWALEREGPVYWHWTEVASYGKSDACRTFSAAAGTGAQSHG